jgi:hypothetical protein
VCRTGSDAESHDRNTAHASAPLDRKSNVQNTIFFLPWPLSSHTVARRGGVDVEYGLPIIIEHGGQCLAYDSIALRRCGSACAFGKRRRRDLSGSIKVVRTDAQPGARATIALYFGGSQTKVTPLRFRPMDVLNLAGLLSCPKICHPTRFVSIQRSIRRNRPKEDGERGPIPRSQEVSNELISSYDGDHPGDPSSLCYSR